MRFAFLIGLLLCAGFSLQAQKEKSFFRALAFYTARHDLAHISFVDEAKQWFALQSKKQGFDFYTTNDWDKLCLDTLVNYDVVIFLDTRPDSLAQRSAFEQYMERGGAWMGFHFAAFALTPSQYPENWPWYHEQFLGSGEYKSNTWRPTAARLRIDQPKHPIAKGLPRLFLSSPNEWYCWKNDLRKNKDIQVLLSIDSSSFPLGTGPKPWEIWHSGDYPVAWTNKQYRMIYFNMGHNDMDYEGKTNKQLSYTFNNPLQDQLVLNALQWLGKKVK